MKAGFPAGCQAVWPYGAHVGPMGLLWPPMAPLGPYGANVLPLEKRLFAEQASTNAECQLQA